MKEDSSLAEIRRIGGEQVGGFMVEENGMLVQVKLMAPGKEVKRVLVPIRKKEILDITHRGLVGGHYLNFKKNLCKSVRAVYMVRPSWGCKKVLSSLPRLPYHRLAADLVGHLHRTKPGFITFEWFYVWEQDSYMLFHSQKKIGAESVVEGLIEMIFLNRNSSGAVD